MNDILEQQLVSITAKVSRLKIRMTRLEAENDDLKKSVFEYLQRIDIEKKKFADLQSEMKNNQMAAQLASQKKEISREIDKYILMLDKCVANIKTKL